MVELHLNIHNNISELGESLDGQRLSEDISQFVFGGDPDRFDVAVRDLLADEMMFHMEVLLDPRTISNRPMIDLL